MAADAVAAILENGRGRAEFCDLAVLDFASFTNPGGGYTRGSWAQEEALCAESFLYNVLEKQGDWYGENRRRNINCDLYRNRALVVPKVRFSVKDPRLRRYCSWWPRPTPAAPARSTRSTRPPSCALCATAFASPRHRRCAGSQAGRTGRLGLWGLWLGAPSSCRVVPRGAGIGFPWHRARDLRRPARSLQREPRVLRARALDLPREESGELRRRPRRAPCGRAGRRCRRRG
ncbi:MAG: TIGR02452 family protein [Collinsella sp.]